MCLLPAACAHGRSPWQSGEAEPRHQPRTGSRRAAGRQLASPLLHRRVGFPPHRCDATLTGGGDGECDDDAHQQQVYWKFLGAFGLKRDLSNAPMLSFPASPLPILPTWNLPQVWYRPIPKRMLPSPSSIWIRIPVRFLRGCC